MPKRHSKPGTTRKCPVCNKRKSLDSAHFAPEPRISSGFRMTCRQCRAARQLEIIHKNPEAHKAYKRDYAKRRPDVVLKGHLRKYHGITINDYNEMLNSQKDKCAICSKTQNEVNKAQIRLHVDHDHKTKHIRGLLCSNCNLGLGYFSDNVENLLKAIRYLQRPKPKIQRIDDNWLVRYNNNGWKSKG